MKRLSAFLVIGLLSVYCFAQTQIGDASYNASKKGLTLAHSSMSFGTRVRITNERNNREVIAAVDDRIPASDPRIADISKEAGDAIGMSQSGYTRVRLEELIPERPAAAPPASSEQTPPAAAQGAPAAAPAPSSTRQQEAVVETIQIVSPAQAAPPVQYVVLPSSEGQNCFNSPLCVAILVLLIIAVLILAAILVLLLYMRRVPWWPWYYPVWLRRHLRYLKKRVY
ncbi:MAG: hypothetical protein LBF77_03175 [Spirochaetaceae bacterium]|jgi:hypothetical protein|nr:hypothetical protein [Spirochaetaceae bacterium]